jgi:hypothetical protein
MESNNNPQNNPAGNPAADSTNINANVAEPQHQHQSQHQQQPTSIPEDPEMQARLDRLGGEAAPDISPEEFVRLQRLGSVHIDAKGRIRANRREDDDPGVSLRKRRAWYG